MMQLQKLHHSIHILPEPSLAQWLLCVYFSTLQISALSSQTLFMGSMWSRINIINQMVSAMERQEGAVITIIKFCVMSTFWSMGTSNKRKQKSYFLYIY
jgi:hypothetical protein